MDEEYTMECQECGWLGNQADLVSATDDIDDDAFVCCPTCGKKDCFEDLD